MNSYCSRYPRSARRGKNRRWPPSWHREVPIATHEPPGMSEGSHDPRASPIQSPNDRVTQTWSDAETFSPVASLPMESPATRRSQFGSPQPTPQPAMSTALTERINARTNLFRPAIRHPLVEANTCPTALSNRCRITHPNIPQTRLQPDNKNSYQTRNLRGRKRGISWRQPATVLLSGYAFTVAAKKCGPPPVSDGSSWCRSSVDPGCGR